MSNSKPLGIDDVSGFEFVKEMLNGDSTYGINFDRIQWNKDENKFVIFEWLLCDEKQPKVTPYSSHPNKYWFKNKHKFLGLWKITQQINGILFLVNYSKKGTKNENEILLMKVLNVTENDTSNNFVQTENHQTTRDKFSKWFRQYNQKGNID